MYGERTVATRGEEPQLCMARERRLRVVRSRCYAWRENGGYAWWGAAAMHGEGTAATRGEEPQLYMVRERRLRVVRSRSYAW